MDRKEVVLARREFTTLREFKSVNTEDLEIEFQEFGMSSVPVDVEYKTRLVTEYYGHDGAYDLYLEAYRLENEEEYAERIEIEKRELDLAINKKNSGYTSNKRNYNKFNVRLQSYKKSEQDLNNAC